MSALLQLIRQLPSVGKYLILLVLALNAHSLPFIWHLRFWWRLGPRYLLVWTRGRQAYIDKCQKKIQATGGISARVISRRRAWFDDCDYNFHLSNSCYAKSADHSMSGWMWDALPIFFEAGGYSALGGTHYTFIREIPILSEYTIETRTVGWGDKWYYLVTEFVIYPKKSAKKVRSKTEQSQTPGPRTISPPSGDATDSLSASDTATPPDVAPPGTDLSFPSKPSPNTAASPLLTASDVTAQALASLRTPRTRADGGVVAGIAVHELCMKIGRMTVPPRIGFHLAGHSTDASAKAHAGALASNKKLAAAWLAGGWKSEANASDIGRDIMPCMAVSIGNAVAPGEKEAVNETSSARLARDQVERAAKGMEAVSVGLGETVRL